MKATGNILDTILPTCVRNLCAIDKWRLLLELHPLLPIPSAEAQECLNRDAAPRRIQRSLFRNPLPRVSCKPSFSRVDILVCPVNLARVARLNAVGLIRSLVRPRRIVSLVVKDLHSIHPGPNSSEISEYQVHCIQTPSEGFRKCSVHTVE